MDVRGVELAVVFGSFLDGKEFRDVDVAVYSEGLDLEDLLKLGAELELGVPVDLVPLDQLRWALLIEGRTDVNWMDKLRPWPLAPSTSQ
jgi:predicted nucleotidyltransferase